MTYDQDVHKKMYRAIKDDIEIIYENALSMKQQELEPKEQLEHDNMTATLRQTIETMKFTKSIRKNIDMLRLSHDRQIKAYYEILTQTTLALSKRLEITFKQNNFESSIESFIEAKLYIAMQHKNIDEVFQKLLQKDIA